jgi:hypothetical protein
MSDTPRNEIVQLSGTTILFGMALIGSLLVVGFVLRYHYHQLYVDEKAHNIRMTALYDEAHGIKEAVVRLEGVKNWNETSYVKGMKI